ncbi:MAG: MBL fold metallo-hydrolase [Gemmatimonadetes bacterium]|nr:MBL fold metallo-hydrolase [Gemmatimonadota bacterium]MYD13742.1 MBL fold metallo-hydrolase [Gemmatimonadota bacterium]
MVPPVKSFLAPNPGPITLEGTRTYVVGEDPAAVIDPGPRIESHISAVAGAVGRAAEVVILLTHAHDDHAAAAARLAHRTGASVHGPGGDHDLTDGQVIHTSGGDLAAISTPGHARRHFCFHHPATASIFVGDLILGDGDTTWIGEYAGAVADYLRSLDRLAALGARRLHPAHGPAIHDPAGTIARFRAHRLERIEQVRRAVADGHAVTPAIARHVYGPLPPKIRAMAEASVDAILDYLSGAE